MTEDLTLREFPPVSTGQWDEAVRKDLKGAAPRQKLYYRAEDLLGLEYPDAAPGQFPYTRGTRGNNAWCIREVVRDANAARAALDAGADEIAFVVGGQAIDEFLDGLPLDRCAVHFEAGARAAQVLEALVGKQIHGSVDYEPLGDFDRAAKLIRATLAPQFRPVTVRAYRFSEAGCTQVQELGFAVAEGVEILAQLTGRGLTPADAASALAFSFAIGANYFFEIAKLRAARTAWARAVESFRPGAISS